MLFYQRNHQQCHGACRRRDHSGAPAYKGDDSTDTEGGVETDFGIYPGDDGKGDGFRDQRECDHQPREHVATDVGKPRLSKFLQHRKYPRQSIAHAKGMASESIQIQILRIFYCVLKV